MSKILKSFEENELALKNYLRRFFSRPQDIEDVTQEAFLKSFATEMRTEVQMPKALLFQAAKHIALNQIAKKENTLVDYTEDLGGTDALHDRKSFDAEEKLDSKRKLIIFSKALASLPPDCRQIFILRRVEGLRLKEIASQLNVSVSTVEKKVALGLIKCGLYFKEKGYDPTEFGSASLEKWKDEKFTK